VTFFVDLVKSDCWKKRPLLRAIYIKRVLAAAQYRVKCFCGRKYAIK